MTSSEPKNPVRGTGDACPVSEDSRVIRPLSVVCFVILFGILTGVEAPAGSGITTRVSLGSAGNQGNAGTHGPAFSADGRYVTFESLASNLVAGDTNGCSDVFVRDIQTGWITRVSVDSGGIEGNNGSWNPSISADGRYVAFASYASNLVPGDTNLNSDIFIHDWQTGETIRASVSSNGTQGDFDSDFPSISADGQIVAFQSYASNLVAGDTNDLADIFVYVRATGQTTRVSVNSAGAQANGASSNPAISADGHYVTLASSASNLVAGDTNVSSDIFVHELRTGQTVRVNVTSAGGQANSDSTFPWISADGRYVVFQSFATNLVAGDTNRTWDVFVHDRQAMQTTRVSVSGTGTQGNGASQAPSISGNGRYVAFQSFASNLVPGDTNGLDDVFVHDRQTGRTSRASVDSAGNQWNANSYYSAIPALSGDGRCVAFETDASNLVAGDTNGAADVFVRRIATVSSDFDGDGNTDVSVWRPESGVWYISRSSDGGTTATVWGSGAYNDRVVPGDYDGDGKTDVAYYRPSTGAWSVTRSTDNVVVSFTWGNSTDVPVPADYDGDGKTDVAVYRPSSGVWFILRSSDGYSQSLYKAYLWGGDPTDIPVPGDYDGDGKADAALFRASSGVWYLLLSSTGYVQAQYQAYLWGDQSTDVPAPGDYDGDGKTDIAVWRPTEGVWYFLRSSTGYDKSQYQAYRLGDQSTDIPVPGDFDGDGRTDVAIWRPADGVWYIIRSSDGVYAPKVWGSGSFNDVPIRARY